MAKKVLYPGCFRLQPYMSEQKAGPLDYVFCAVLVPSGGSCHRQPYFCYVKAGNGQWYKMDDAKVTACDVASALSQSAYVLFYVQKSSLEGDGGGPSPGGAPTSLGLTPQAWMQPTGNLEEMPASEFLEAPGGNRCSRNHLRAVEMLPRTQPTSA